MTQEQWERIRTVAEGETPDRPVVAFIIDSPWLPNWAGMSILDYYTSELRWFDAHLAAIRRFPGVIFLPGFWAEWGMCTEPSAFGAKCVWHDNEFPFAERRFDSIEAAAAAPAPNPRTDGLAPFVIKRLQHARPLIEAQGHAIRFAVARGPLNIAGFLLGNTEFLMAMKMAPDATHEFLDKITGFLVEWIQAQAAAFPTIDGILLLDDLVGFCGDADFREFALPCLQRCFAAIPASVRLFHNDAHGLVCAPHLAGAGVNCFNFSHEHPMNEVRRLAGPEVALLGNIPPRDVLAQGTPDAVRASVRELIRGLGDRAGVLLSCGGGMPPGVPTENIEAFLEAAAETW
ncbi:MAG TPA: uroporphyrinogen decarboxylase [Candidatus Hydrogenedentes bacterium]|nr:uroporphyrinogen decarboxylase [Candidatus Hydrogenedentota bacterium]